MGHQPILSVDIHRLYGVLLNDSRHSCFGNATVRCSHGLRASHEECCRLIILNIVKRLIQSLEYQCLGIFSHTVDNMLASSSRPWNPGSRRLTVWPRTIVAAPKKKMQKVSNIVTQSLAVSTFGGWLFQLQTLNLSNQWPYILQIAEIRDYFIMTGKNQEFFSRSHTNS
jgi:hypothetical protein